MNKLPPGPKRHLLLGNFNQFLNQRLELLMRCRREFGDIVYLRVFDRHLYLLNNPEYVHYVLVDAPEKFRKGRGLQRASELIGNGLLTSEGDFWRRQRKLIQPAFHHKRIAAYGDTMVNHTVRLVDTWDSTIDVGDQMMRLTLGIVAQTLFGANVSSEAEQIGEAVTEGIEYVIQRTMMPITLPRWLPTAQNRAREQLLKVINTVIMRIIEERRTAGNEDRGDLLSMLLLAQAEDGSGMTDQQVFDEVITLFLAGHETTALTLTWALYLLAQHPEIEEKLVDELQTVLAGRAPTVTDLPNLRYNEMIVKETLRLYPPAWGIPRIALEDVQIGGYTIAKGRSILMSPYIMHRDERYFSEPELFLPERWMDDLEKLIPRYAYFPFGGGPRVCIGNNFALMEAQLLLATIMQHYHLSLLPDQKVKLNASITLRPHGKIMMQPTVREPMTAAI